MGQLSEWARVDVVSQWGPEPTLQWEQSPQRACCARQTSDAGHKWLRSPRPRPQPTVGDERIVLSMRLPPVSHAPWDACQSEPDTILHLSGLGAKIAAHFLVDSPGL